MREVSGENISVKELKNCYFGYSDNVDFDEMVEVIECNGCRFAVTEDGDAFIRYPIDINSDIIASYSKLDEKEIGTITVYNFINNWWGLDEFDLEEFTFYFAE